MLERYLQNLLNKYGLSAFPLDLSAFPINDENNTDAEWRIIDTRSSLIFQGTLDRCSDFAKGLHYGKTGERQL